MDDDQRGIIFILLGMGLFSIQDIIIKVISDEASLIQIFTMRGLIGSVLIILFMKYGRNNVNLGSGAPVIAIFRAILFTIGFICFYLSLTILPLAVATALFFLSPFFITILSVIFLKTAIGWYRIAALIAGFIGTLLIVKPIPENFVWGSLLPIICAFFYSSSMIMAKASQAKDSNLQQALHVYFGAIILGTIISLTTANTNFPLWENPELDFLIREWRWDNTFILSMILLISMIGSLGIILLITAYRSADPGVIAPFEYSLLVIALIVGYVAFDEAIDLYSLVGMLLIVGSGIYIFAREKIRRKPLTVKTSLRT